MFRVAEQFIKIENRVHDASLQLEHSWWNFPQLYFS